MCCVERDLKHLSADIISGCVAAAPCVSAAQLCGMSGNRVSAGRGYSVCQHRRSLGQL